MSDCLSLEIVCVHFLYVGSLGEGVVFVIYRVVALKGLYILLCAGLFAGATRCSPLSQFRMKVCAVKISLLFLLRIAEIAGITMMALISQISNLECCKEAAGTVEKRLNKYTLFCSALRSECTPS